MFLPLNAILSGAAGYGGGGLEMDMIGFKDNQFRMFGMDANGNTNVIRASATAQVGGNRVVQTVDKVNAQYKQRPQFLPVLPRRYPFNWLANNDFAYQAKIDKWKACWSCSAKWSVHDCSKNRER